MKKVTIDNDALVLVAKRAGMTMHSYINSNKDIIFEVFYPCYGILIVHNELPGPYISYDIQPIN